MSDDNKPGDDTKKPDEAPASEKPAAEAAPKSDRPPASEKKAAAESEEESITKIEKRKSEPPSSERTARALEEAKEKAAAREEAKAAAKEEAAKDEPKNDEAKKDEPKKAEPKKAESKKDDDDSPTAAQTPLAKKDDKKKAEPAKKTAPAKSKARDEDDEDDEDEDEDEAPAKRPAVKRPAPVARKDSPSSDARRTRASGESLGLLAVVGGVLIVGNLALKGVSRFRIDATKEERFSLSKKGTGHLLSTLQKQLYIEVFIPKGLATMDAFERDLRDLLDEYERYGNGKVKYEIVDINSLEGEAKQKAEAKAQEAGLKKSIFGEAKGAGAKQAAIGEGYLGMVLSYGGERATIDQQDGLDERNPQGLEFLISNKIRELRDKEDNIVHKIGYLQGHKEKGYQEISQIFGKYFPYYKFESVDLNKGEKDVPDDLDGLIITSPDEEIPSKELRRIDKFLMKGKALAVFANNLHLKDADASMNATFSGMGVEKLLSGYGIDFKNELLVDKTQFWTPVLMGPQGIGIQLDPYPLIFMADDSRGDKTFDASFAPLFRLRQVAVPFPTEITVDQARAGGAGVKVTPVIRTSQAIVTVQGSTISLHPAREKLGNGATGQKEEKRQAIIAVNLEGPIKSAFPGGGEGVEGVPTNATGNARLFVISSGAFLNNAFADAGKSPFGGMMPGMDPNMGADEELMRYAQIYNRARISSYLVAKQTCDWMSQETDLLAVGPKLLAEPELTYPKSPAPTPAVDEKIDSESFRKKKQAWIDSIKSEQRFITVFNVFAGAIIICGIGIYRWWNRNARRAAVQI